MGMESFDCFDTSPLVERTPRDEALAFLGGLRRGDGIKVQSFHGIVYRANGADVLVTKQGTKGRKLYKIETISIEPFTVNVIESFELGRLGSVAVTGAISRA